MTKMLQCVNKVSILELVCTIYTVTLGKLLVQYHDYQMAHQDFLAPQFQIPNTILHSLLFVKVEILWREKDKQIF